MKWLAWCLLASETLLAAYVWMAPVVNNAAVLLLAGNSLLLIWCGTRLRRKPSCCR